ncbi:MAG: radical SAM protein [Elusimicrobia bacterium]|nr:radical SAM protein [Elusimicrobiota bacterium]
MESIDANMLRLIRYCRNPRPSAEVQRLHALSADAIRDLLERGVLVEASGAWRETRVTTVEIEISTHCNWRCRYCPVSVSPKLPASMEMDLFQEILDKAAGHSSVDTVQFEAYNEPALDVRFEERVRLVSKTRLMLKLYTNGSLLDEGKIDLLQKTGVLKAVRFNLPAADKETFRKMTGSTSFDKTLRHIDYAIARGLPVELSIQGGDEEVARNRSGLIKRYGAIAEKEYAAMRGRSVTTDRCAEVAREPYRKDVRIRGRLAGCRLPLRVVVIGIHGAIYLCCEDYHQRTAFGNIRDGSLEDLLSGPEAVRLRRRVFGLDWAADDFICRSCILMRDAVQRQSTVHTDAD